jgi:hypothetical protein
MGLFKTQTLNEKRVEEYSDKVIELKNKVVDLQLELKDMADSHQKLVSIKDEEFDRERREIEHKTGLMLKQVEEDRKAAVKEAELRVREENLNAERERDSKESKYKQQRMDEEMRKMDNLMKQVLDRLPNVNYNLDRTIHEGDPKQIEASQG